MFIEKFRLVLILGCQRSGTTLLGQILGAQQSAILVDEEDGSLDLVKTLISNQDVEETLRQALIKANTKYGKGDRVTSEGEPLEEITHIIIKVPNATYFREQLVQLPLQISYLFSVRDVRDVVCSMARLPHIPMIENQVWRLKQIDSMHTRFSNELIDLVSPEIAPYVKRALIWRIKTSLYREFEAVPTSALTVHYEDLVTNPSDCINRILKHVGMVIDTPLITHESSMKGVGFGFTFRKRPIDRASLNRWTRCLNSTEEEQIWQIAGTLMQELGYQRYGQPERPVLPYHLIESPVITIGRGGSGTRLISQMLQQLGLFLGNNLNGTDDSVEWADLIYEMVLKTMPLRPERFGPAWIDELHARAGAILSVGAWKSEALWGFKLPETLLVLPEILKAFPEAIVIHLIRHPIDSCLRRTHMTSRMDNSIGKAVLTAAYQSLGWKTDPECDEDYLRNAASWYYQMSWINEVIDLEEKQKYKYLLVRYEDLCADPGAVQDILADNLGIKRKPCIVHIDEKRRRQWADDDSRANEIWQICGKVAAQFGYSRQMM